MITETLILAEIKCVQDAQSFHGNPNFRDHVRLAEVDVTTGPRVAIGTPISAGSAMSVSRKSLGPPRGTGIPVGPSVSRLATQTTSVP
jgi:hypothetical protein